jgi:hypothetical protein
MEEVAVETFGAPKKQYGDRYLAIECHQQLQKWIQGDGGYQKKLASAHRGMTSCAIRALCKDTVVREGPGRDMVARGTLKGQIFGKRCWAQSECNGSIRN